MLTHQVRRNGQHRVLCSDGRWRRTGERLRSGQRLNRPDDRIIDLRYGRFAQLMRNVSVTLRVSALAFVAGMRKAVAATAAFEEQQARVRATLRSEQQ